MSTTKQCNRNHHPGERDRTKRRAEENSDQRACRAESSADERHQCDVAEAHCLTFRHHLAEPADDGDHARPGTCTDERIIRRSKHVSFADEKRDHRRHDHEHQPSHREAVGDQIVFRVGDGHAEQNGSEHGNAQGSEREPEVLHREQPTDRHHELDQRVHQRDRLVAATAPPAKRDPTQHRNVLEPRELVRAPRTTRARTKHGALTRPAHDADIQERPDTRANDERVDLGDERTGRTGHRRSS